MKRVVNALATQVGGRHYKVRAIQPVEYIHANKLDYFQGCVVKYITRWRDKGGFHDLRKIQHYIDLYIQLELRNENAAHGEKVRSRRRNRHTKNLRKGKA